MTWSIIAKDPQTGFFGIAIASRFLAVGALCPWAEAGRGAVCTQAMINPLFGPRALAHLREGFAAADVCDMTVAADKEPGGRQLHLVDAAGRSAAYTGPDCIAWCGHEAAEGVSVAGNMLAGPAVVAETMAAYRAQAEAPIVERLLAAMAAGEAAGGDKRGKQAAALLIQGPDPYPRLDLRVDDHADPLAELARLYEVAKGRLIPFTTAYPCPERPYGITDRDFLETIIEREVGKPLGPAIEVPPR